MGHINHITGFILAGGKSSRFGQNKALLTLNGKPLILSLLELMQSVFSDVNVITNSPEEYGFLSVSKYRDIYPSKGPLSGVHTALSVSRTTDVFVLSCDLPLISAETIRKICEHHPTSEAVLPVAGGIVQPLAARYNIGLVQLFEQHLTAATMDAPLKSIRRILPENRYSLLETGKDEENNFFNLNTPVDFEILKRLLQID